MEKRELQRSIKEWLCGQGLPRDVSDSLSGVIMECALAWRPENDVKPEEAESIIIFGFDYITDSIGNRRPGEINRVLAVQAIKHYRKRNRHVYAQWEAAEFLQGEIPDSLLHAIYPEKDEKKGIVSSHFSSEDVLKSAIEKGLTGPVLVIAHYFSLRRSMNWVKHYGFAATSDPKNMPLECYSDSSIAWTRTPLVNLVSHILSNLWFFREHNIYPNLPS